MRFSILFLLLLGFVPYSAQHIERYRILISDAEKSSSNADEFFNHTERQYIETRKPIYKALMGVGCFLKASHTYIPFKKISYFKKGKILLDEAITEDPQNLEMRLLRYLSQKKTPSILGYKKNMESDKVFLKKNIGKTKDQELIKEIKKIID